MGSLPSKRKRIATQTSPQLNTWHNQSYSVSLPVASSPIVVAVGDFPSGDTEPILRMGEQLSLLSEEGEWWQVKSVATDKECYVPSNNIAKISHRWLYDGIDRAKAEELLLLPANQEGSFLIRKRQVRKGCYSLSIRYTNRASWNCIKHYRINCLENSWLYISPSLTFPSLHELVDYYSESSDGLCCCLKKPCFIQGTSSSLFHNLSKPVEVKKSALNWQEINSSDLLSEDPLTEDSPISLGLREAVSTYLFMTEDLPLGDTPNRKGRQSKDI
ncbi:src-like-adapter 2 [Python bivittatus]|uniref:Src-like-adapter 2 n=1 Tax=Python bivittatus TaxID=176946 RepID=A0A9F2NIM4_PYTBI|nr:src-like-adapter 2 [Python bivittatus]XP_015743564.1 src-like-adapter 2 [Python bivittatus]XP_015743565.1 src-like-adapter 2 [Python bivittatus]